MVGCENSLEVRELLYAYARLSSIRKFLPYDVYLAKSQQNRCNLMCSQLLKLLAFIHVTFNPGGAMAVPPGVNEAAGPDVALSRLGLSRRNVVGIGDAENDHLLLAYCEYEVGVENASLHFKQPPLSLRVARTARRCRIG